MSGGRQLNKCLQESTKTCVEFLSARLFNLPTACYIELSGPKISKDLFNCSFCRVKKGVHEHDFFGKIKYEPKDCKYLVSIVLRAKTSSSQKDATTIDNNSVFGPQIDSSLKNSGETPKSLKDVASSKTRANNDCPTAKVDVTESLKKTQLPGNSILKTRKATVILANSNSDIITPSPDSVAPVIVSNEVEAARSLSRSLSLFVADEEARQNVVAVRLRSNNAVYKMKAEKAALKKMNPPRNSILDKTEKSSKLDSSEQRELANSGDCPRCVANEFSTISELQDHFMNQHGLRVKIHGIPRVVSVWNVNKDAQSSNSRRFTTNKDPIFQCEKCEIIFDSDENRIRHQNERHAPSFQCHICLRKLSSHIQFVKHAAIHRKDRVRRHECKLCDKKFLRVIDLKKHRICVHLGVKNHACVICDKRYSTLFSLNLHRINTHAQGEKPKCEICNKMFYTKSRLRTHILETHDQDYRLGCHICGKFYLRMDNLKKHVVEFHQEDRRFPCLLCAPGRVRVYCSNLALEKHFKTFHGILPWNRGKLESQIQQKEKYETTDKNENDTSIPPCDEGQIRCQYCMTLFAEAEIESHLRFSHGVLPSGILPPMGTCQPSLLPGLSAAEALLKTLTPQPDYLLQSLTPLPLDDLLLDKM